MDNDLISRSELKSVLKNECFWCANRDEPCDKSCWHCINEKIDNAPTVDFEKLGESLRCQIRAEYGSCDDCELSCPRNELIKLLDSVRSQGDWIPVSERLPEERGMYLVTEKVFAIDDRNHIGKFKVETEQVEFYDGKWNRAKFFEVIAWMPLPEPYRKGGAE